MAQDAVKEGEETEKKVKKAEKIQVTGSRIKRTEIEGVSPVEVISREDIEQSGVTTVAELISNRPVSSAGAYANHNGGSENRSITRIDLRGMGPENTLVLLDGRRLPDEGGAGFVDISTIPVSAVERIEILKDSASALYGSDAMSGVVNIITRKDYDGTMVAAKASKPKKDGGLITEYTVMQGTTSGRFNNLIVMNYTHGDAVFMDDRDWTDSYVVSWASPRANAYLYPGPVGGQSCTGDPGFGTPCTGDYTDGHMLTPETDNLSILDNMSYDINSNLRAFATLRAVQNKTHLEMSPAPGRVWAGGDFLQFRNPPTDDGPSTAIDLPAGGAVMFGDTLGPWGPRVWDTDKTALGGVIGVEGDLGVNWEWQASASRTDTTRDLTLPDGFADRRALSQAVRDGRYDPTSGFASAQVVADTKVEPYMKNEANNSVYDVNFTGELFEMAGGSAAVAVGLMHTRQEYSIDFSDEWSTRYDDTVVGGPFQFAVPGVDPNSVVMSVTPQNDGSGSREITALYAEFVLPLTEKFEAQLAARHDRYSDFGDTTNPKLGLKYMFTPRFLVRGSAGTGFKAPTLARLYGGKEVLWQDVIDRGVDNNDDGMDDAVRIPVETVASPDLKEETSVSYTFGFVTEPVDGFSLGVDYWYVKIKDVIKPMDFQSLVDQAAGGDAEMASRIVRNAGDNTLSSITGMEFLNLGEKEDAGVDVNARANFRQGSTRWTLGSAYSAKLYSKEIAAPGEAQVDTLGEKGKPRWRAVNSIGANFLRRHNLGLNQNVIARQETGTPNPEAQKFIDQSITYDLFYAWNHAWNGTVSLGALNVLNTPFPRDNSNPTRTIDGAKRVDTLFSVDDGIRYMVGLEQTF